MFTTHWTSFFDVRLRLAAAGAAPRAVFLGVCEHVQKETDDACCCSSSLCRVGDRGGGANTTSARPANSRAAAHGAADAGRAEEECEASSQSEICEHLSCTEESESLVERGGQFAFRVLCEVAIVSGLFSQPIYSYSSSGRQSAPFGIYVGASTGVTREEDEHAGLFLSSFCFGTSPSLHRACLYFLSREGSSSPFSSSTANGILRWCNNCTRNSVYVTPGACICQK